MAASAFDGWRKNVQTDVGFFSKYYFSTKVLDISQYIVFCERFPLIDNCLIWHCCMPTDFAGWSRPSTGHNTLQNGMMRYRRWLNVIKN
jgi:hypothetical protein